MTAKDISRETTNVILDKEVSTEIIAKAVGDSAFMQAAPRMELIGAGKKFQTITGDPTPAWTGETAAAPVDKYTFNKKEVEPYKLTLIVPFSNEFKRDKDALYNECVNRIPKLFGKKFDETIAGSTKPGTNFDVLGGSTAISLTPASGKSLYDQFVAVDETISTAGFMMDKIVLAPQGRSKVLGAKDNDGRPLFTANVTSGNIDNILGATVSTAKGVYVAGSGSGDSAVPATLGFAGDFEECAWGCVDDIQASISEQATIVEGTGDNATTINLWQDDMFAIRFTFSLAFMVRYANAFVKLTA